MLFRRVSAFVASADHGHAHDPDGPQVRGVLFAAMPLTFIVALAVPGAFGADALLFVLAYSGVRFLHLALYVDAAHRLGFSVHGVETGARVNALVGEVERLTVSKGDRDEPKGDDKRN